MRIALLGAGIIGTVIARDLAAWDPPDEVRIGDLDGERAEAAAREHGYEAARVNVNDPDSLDRFLEGSDVVINAVQYQANLAVMEGAFRTGVDYLDLGGLFHVTRKQLELHDWFQKGGITAVLGMGSCPGIANVHAGDLASRLDAVRSIRIYNGATVDPPGTIAWPYSLWTILDEIVERPVVFESGEFVERDPLSGEQAFAFLNPIGEANTHLSLHSEVATIPMSLADQGIEECSFRIRFFGMPEDLLRHLAWLVKVGLASTDPRQVDGVEVVPRRLLVDVLEAHRASLGHQERDELGFKDIATVAEGTKDGEEVRLRIDTTAWPSEVLEVPGGTVAVVAPAAVVARWLAEGRIDQPGVHAPETIIPPEPFYEALEIRGVETRLVS